MPPPTPPEEIPQLMRFIAEKAKNVKYPMNITQLCRQFQKETGSSISVFGLRTRIEIHRQRIHEMNEFDLGTKVKMIFALSAPIDAGFLSELKKVADVEVDGQQRIIQYKQKDGGLESISKMLFLMDQREDRNKNIIQFLAEKTETANIPIIDIVFLREFKTKTECPDSLKALKDRYARLKKKLFQLTEFDKNTKIKMIFISHAKLTYENLKELRKDAYVEVDKKGRITKYKAMDGSLELEGSHGPSSIQKAVHSDRWRTIYQKAIENDSEEGDDEDTNFQKDDEKKQIDLVRFLIQRTKHATFPLTIRQLAKDYQAEFKSSKPLTSMESWIQKFRQQIHEMNQFDPSVKVKMLFALSVPIDANFLNELQNDAVVELDKNQRIKRYKAKDGSLELEGVHRTLARGKSEKGNEKKKTRVVNGLNDSEVSESSPSQNLAAIQKGRKRVRQISDEDEDGEPLKVEDDSEMDFDTSHAYDFDYDPSNYELDMDHVPIEKKPESLIDVKTEESSTTIKRNHHEENFLQYDLLNYVDEHIPEEKKPENLLEVKTELPEEPSTSNLDYHYEENSEKILIEPKPEII